MKVRPGRPPTASDGTDRFSLSNRLTFANRDVTEMGVTGKTAFSMAKEDHAAISPAMRNRRHHPVAGRQYRIPSLR
jgi:hypothetical protein